MTQEEAERRVDANDRLNAEIVAATRDFADWRVSVRDGKMMQYWKPEAADEFVGDMMPYWDGRRFHLFYLLDRGHHAEQNGLGGHQWAHASTG